MKLRDMLRSSMTSANRRPPAWAVGRYGVDDLGRATLVAAVVCIALSLVPQLRFLAVAAFALLGLGYWRMLSRNVSKRYQENMKYLRCLMWFRDQRNNFTRFFASHKANRYFKCPQCHRTACVPRGTGNVKITCRQCKTVFYKKA